MLDVSKNMFVVYVGPPPYKLNYICDWLSTNKSLGFPTYPSLDFDEWFMLYNFHD